MLLKYTKKYNNLLTMKTQTIQLKMYKDFNRLYMEEDILMANTQIKICSTFCHIYHIQIERKNGEKRDFPANPVVKTVLPIQGCGFKPWSGN